MLTTNALLLVSVLVLVALALAHRIYKEEHEILLVLWFVLLFTTAMELIAVFSISGDIQ